MTPDTELEKLNKALWITPGNVAREKLLRQAYTLGKKEGIKLGFEAGRELGEGWESVGEWYYPTLADYEKEGE